MEITVIRDILAKKFDKADVDALMDTLQICRKNPQEIVDMINLGLTHFSADRVRRDVTIFCDNWYRAASLLGDTPEGDTFRNLCKMGSDILDTIPTVLN